ncbi:MAG: 3-dehydroquinate synthase [Sphaerochaetaceae bacterium]|nr:3-dehydroquinate synthase [Sphaerochaetaceae bacterium]
MQEVLSCLGTKVLLADNFQDLSNHVSTLGTRTLWVCDTNTARMVRPLPEPNIIIENGENHKIWSSVERIINIAQDNNLGRECTFIGLGGGVICDLTAFAASIYMRGCRCVLIPTTLLSMADAPLGGKTGFNFRSSKNLIGTFFPANEILICTDALKSLPTKEYESGFAVLIKHSLLVKDDTLFNLLAKNKDKFTSRNPEILRNAVALSLSIKKTYVVQDPYERQGIMEALNLGATFGYALQTLYFNQWSFGQSIAWGLCKAVEASAIAGLCPKEFSEGITKLCHFYGYNVSYRINRGEWIDYKKYLSKDKRIIGTTKRFVLLKGQGEYVIEGLDEDIIKAVVLKSSY